MILIGLGSNLPGPSGSSQDIIMQALARLNEAPIKVVAHSRLWQTAPVPVSDQPWFINAVAIVETGLDPVALLAHLHGIEAAFGRERREINAARTLDLDLLDYNGLVRLQAPTLPHPRLVERSFVLLPLREIAPEWRHPISGAGLDSLIAGLPAGQQAEAFT